MSRSIFSAPHFNDEAAAYAYVETRLWKDGRACPHCGVIGRSGQLKGKSNRPGLWKCYACRKPFTVKLGTIFEASHIQMRDWLTAIHLLCSSKKGIGSQQLARTLGLTVKSAWFMSHRIRAAMVGDASEMMGGEGGDVQVDETFIFTDKDAPPVKGKYGITYPAKINVLSLIDRQSGEARSFVVDTLQAKDVAPILRDNIAKDTRLGRVDGIGKVGDRWIPKGADR